jgi:hypothetical protein
VAETAQEVGAERFSKRLGELCLCNLSGVPRRNVDRQILLKSAALSIGRSATFSEAEVNWALLHWRSAFGLELDHVSWRRLLVDAGYLQRDRARTVYSVAQPSEERTGVRFTPDVEEVVVLQVADDFRREAASKREGYLRSRRP